MQHHLANYTDCMVMACYSKSASMPPKCMLVSLSMCALFLALLICCLINDVCPA